MRILYLYTSGRKERLIDIELGNAPREFLHGYTYLRDQGFDVDYLETDHLAQAKWSLEFWKLRYQNNSCTRKLRIGNRSHYFVDQIDYLNTYDVIIATTDAIALGLAYFKRSRRLRAEIIYLSMGLASALNRIKRCSKTQFSKFKAMCGLEISQFQKIWTAGKAEKDFFCSEYEQFKTKFVYSPWGVDLEFWHPSESGIDQGQYILFVGNDMNRDFVQLVEIAKQRPTVNFVFVTTRLNSKNCSDNVRLYKGSLKNQYVSDVELRDLYSGAALVIIPLQESLQPSGQSVSLQAMACGCPVAITNTSGLWDPLLMRNGDTCILVTQGISEFLETIDQLADKKKLFADIGHNARQLVVDHHDGEMYAAWLGGIVRDGL